MCTFAGHRKVWGVVSTWRSAGSGASLLPACLVSYGPSSRATAFPAIQLLPVKAPERNFSFPETEKPCPSGARSVPGVPCHGDDGRSKLRAPLALPAPSPSPARLRDPQPPVVCREGGPGVLPTTRLRTLSSKRPCHSQQTPCGGVFRSGKCPGTLH